MALVLIIASQFIDIFWSQINHALWKTRPSDPKFEELAARPQTFQVFSSCKTNFWTANKSV